MASKLKSHHFKIGLVVILNFLKDKRKESLFILGLGLLSAIGNGVIPYITGRLFDKILAPDETLLLAGYQFPLYLVLLVTLALIQLVLIVVEHRKYLLQSAFGFDGRFSYQSAAYAKLLELPVSFHKKRKIGDITTKINSAGMGVEVITERLLGGLGPEFLSVIVAIFFLLTINPVVALVSFLAVGLYVIIAYFFIKDSASFQTKLIRGWGRAYGDVHDVVNNIHTVKQSVTETYEQKRLGQIFKKFILPHWLGMDIIWQTLNTIKGLLVITLQIIVFIWSIRLVLAGTITIGELIAFNSYLAMLFAPFTTLMNMWRIIQNGLLDIAAVEKILALPPENYHPANQVPLEAIRGQIAFQDVSYYYEKDKPVLKKISFEVPAGQVVALVGESGVGKSTLIDLLSAYDFPRQGKILIDGHNIKSLDIKFLRSKIAVVPQEVVLFNDTVKKNIAYGNFKATEEEIATAAKNAHAYDFIQKFPKKWKQIVGERGVKLSVGQKQRIAIARAILRNPSILILDEPTSALDAKSERIIQESLNKLMVGRTTFIVAHRLSTVRQANLILVFEEGQIVERGTHDELIKLTNGRYRNLYELQIGLHK